MQNYEKLGAFYLGRTLDPDSLEPGSDYLMYDAKDLTTHGVCVGMTGSGKTGLCVSLLEEAAIDGIPVIAIDPKGDLGNLMLTFPKLRPADFEPWVDHGAAMRKGQTPQEFAASTAELWRNGLASWDQDGDRIQRLRDAAEVAIYTPGSSAGIPLTVLRSFNAPPAELIADVEAFGDHVMSAVSGLLSMLGYDADPVQSREHILLSHIVGNAWREGRDLSLGDLIQEIQKPPFKKVGFFDVESFFPAKDRFGFAMGINNLLASPAFASWMQGEPLDISRLLWTAEGKPRVSILSIAHLTEEQRMFFVTLVLNELVAWMRTQPGTTSLRALLYMDEVFGYFPPTANPPSKKPMLTLLKQARAYGVGCLLATQNPVDLDYKGLSNCGTWFLGRLQTERDKARVIEGLEGASAAQGGRFDRARMERILAGLGSRRFLMNNVHESEPVLFQTRWAMSYLRGPLTRDQIQKLMADKKAAALAPPAQRSAAVPSAKKAKAAKSAPPVVPPDVEQLYVMPNARVRRDEKLVYRPGLFGEARLHFAASREGVDEWRETSRLAPLDEEELRDPWERSEVCERRPDLDSEPDEDGNFAELPSAATQKKSYRSWQTRLKDHLYRNETMTVWKCKALKQVSQPGASERDFRARLALAAREQRDLAVEKLRKKFAPKVRRMQERIQSAEVRVEKETAQYGQSKLSAALSVGSTLLGALFGRKAVSATNVRRASSTARRAGRALEQRGDIKHAKAKVQGLQHQMVELEEQLEEETAKLHDRYDVDQLAIDSKEIRPRKSDIDISRVVLVWTPWRRGKGKPEPLYN